MDRSGEDGLVRGSLIREWPLIVVIVLFLVRFVSHLEERKFEFVSWSVRRDLLREPWSNFVPTARAGSTLIR